VSDVVIHARDLRKVYRLYSGPTYKFLDMFGLLRSRPGLYTEHAALDGVSMDIKRGEKVAFIGRNGAGKSTLLKLITRVIEPTSGSLDVKGHVHALLQIGTGFHPDFTGRDNVFAYLAQLGVTGAEAEVKFANIVEFAELEDYISQPVKTYSAGMAVRLMFSTATAITPELLVLDEVLGVGDAYFAQKSYERMRELTDRAGTTLLLVTHDVYSAVKICDRLIWIDRGRVLMDGDGPVVIKAYEDSIRQQEETRLRLRKQHRAKESAAASGGSHLIIEIQGADNRPLPAPVYFSRIELTNHGRSHLLPLGVSAFDEAQTHHLQREGTAWGDATSHEGRPARPFLNYGSPFHKVAGVVSLPEGLSPGAHVEIDYWSSEAFTTTVRMFDGNKVRELGVFEGVAGAWQTWAAPVRPASSTAPAATVNATGVHGTGAITVTAMATVNAAGDDVHFFTHGGPFELQLQLRINQPDLAERPQLLVAFHRDGIQDVCRVITRDLLFDAHAFRTGEVRLKIPKLWLGVGNYTVTIMVAREGYYDEEQTRYFSLNPGVYACHTRALEIVVTDGGAVASGTVMVGEGEWTLR
jgi:ABC-type polysaccharide/polyol phosphate transport system ATPase subunit